MRTLLRALAAACIVTTGLPFLRKGHWWIRIWDFPRPQIAAVGLTAFAGLLALGARRGGALDRLLLAGAGFGAAYQAYRIFPFTPLAPKQVLESRDSDPRRKVRVLVSNVRVGNRCSDKLLEAIETSGPDIVLAVETDAFWTRELAALERDFPYTVKQPQDDAYGMLLFSKLRLKDPRIRFLTEEGVPSFHTRVVLRTGDEVYLHCMHPQPPHAFQAASERNAELLIVGREIRHRREPAIVVGDLNDVAWSSVNHLMQRISNLMDPRLGRGLYNTYHAQHPLLMRWPLDHIFFSDEFRFCSLEVLDSIGSDHFPIFAELSYEPSRSDAHDARDLAYGDRAKALRKIRKGLERTTDG